MATPLETFDYIFFVLIHKISIFVAMEVVNKNFRPNFGTFCFMTIMSGASVSSIYVLCTYDMDTALNTITSWGTIIQGVVKYMTIYLKQKEIYEAVMNYRLVYETIGIDSERRYSILCRWGKLFLLGAKALVLVIFGTFGMFILYPVFVYWFTGERVMVYPLLLPYADPNTNMGYAIQSCMQIVWMVQAAFGLAGSDTLLAMMLLHVLPLIEVFETGCDELDHAIALGSTEFRQSLEVDRYLRNLIRMHQCVNKVLETNARIYAFVLFVDVYSNGVTMCFVIFCLMVQTWLPLYALFLVNLVKLFLMCSLGTIIESANDRILNAIQKLKWYLLPVRLQKNIMLMICRAQNPTMMRAGPAPLNLDTFVNIMKNVYSVAMVLAESVN